MATEIHITRLYCIIDAILCLIYIQPDGIEDGKALYKLFCQIIWVETNLLTVWIANYYLFQTNVSSILKCRQHCRIDKVLRLCLNTLFLFLYYANISIQTRRILIKTYKNINIFYIKSEI